MEELLKELNELSSVLEDNKNKLEKAKAQEFERTTNLSVGLISIKMDEDEFTQVHNLFLEILSKRVDKQNKEISKFKLKKKP